MVQGAPGRRANMYSTTWAVFNSVDWNYDSGGVWCGDDFYMLIKNSLRTASHFAGWDIVDRINYSDVEDWMPQLWKTSPEGHELVVGGINAMTTSGLYQNPGAVPDGYGPSTSLSTEVENVNSLCSDGTYIYYTNAADRTIRRFNTETLMLDTILGQHETATPNPSAVFDSGATTVYLYSPAYNFLSYVNVSGGGPTDVPFGATIEPGGANEEDVTVTSIQDYGGYVRWNLQSTLTYDHPTYSSVQFDGVGTPSTRWPYGPTYHDGWVYFWDKDGTPAVPVLRRISTTSPFTVQTLFNSTSHPLYPYADADLLLGEEINPATGVPHFLDSHVASIDVGGLHYYDGYLYWFENLTSFSISSESRFAKTVASVRRIAVSAATTGVPETLYWWQWNRVRNDSPSTRWPGTYGGDYQDNTSEAFGMALHPDYQPEIIYHNFFYFEDTASSLVIYDNQLYVELWNIGFQDSSLADSANWSLVRFNLTDLIAGAPIEHDPFYPMYEYVVNQYPFPDHNKWWGRRVLTQEGFNPYYSYAGMVNGVTLGPDGVYVVHFPIWWQSTYPYGGLMVSHLSETGSSETQGTFRLSFEGQTAQGLVSGQRTKVLGPVVLS